MVKESLERVRERIAAAARAAGRDPSEIRLIAVTKGVPVERIREAIDAGVAEIGENRVQEAVQKQAGLDAPVFWHLIGHLQRNKAGTAVERFDWIQSVDSLDLVEELDRRCGQRGRTEPLKVLLQVNVSGEVTKYGCRPEAAEKLAAALLACRNLRWMGLMTIAPYGENPEAARSSFRGLRELGDRLKKRLGWERMELSMGMSHDFETAVQEGATMLRIGTAIFGERDV